MTAYYNEFDKKTAAWLRELVKRDLIAPGDVDDRPIQEVKPYDIRHYRQVHFFAGIGGWSYALRLAGWPDDRPVWTGSCPCQPFSTAGKQKGAADERHLWPEMFRLVRECRPAIVLGEQVEGAVRHGWLDGVFGDLEGAGYACGAAVLGAHSVGAPHIRQRLYWMADAEHRRQAEQEQGAESWGGGGDARGLADTDKRRCGKCTQLNSHSQQPGEQASQRDNSGRCDIANRLEHAAGDGRDTRRAEPDGRITAARCGTGRLGDADDQGSQGRVERVGRAGELAAGQAGAWDDYTILTLRDGSRRRAPIEPAFQPLATRLPARVVRLCGYGNAIVPQIAAEFVTAYLESTQGA